MAKFTSTTRTAPHAKLTQALIHGHIHQHHRNCSPSQDHLGFDTWPNSPAPPELCFMQPPESLPISGQVLITSSLSSPRLSLSRVKIILFPIIDMKEW